jgi:hypothetical protein
MTPYVTLIILLTYKVIPSKIILRTTLDTNPFDPLPA